jgi:hypothetical protein
MNDLGRISAPSLLASNSKWSFHRFILVVAAARLSGFFCEGRVHLSSGGPFLAVLPTARFHEVGFQTFFCSAASGK